MNTQGIWQHTNDLYRQWAASLAGNVGNAFNDQVRQQGYNPTEAMKYLLSSTGAQNFMSQRYQDRLGKMGDTLETQNMMNDISSGRPATTDMGTYIINALTQGNNDPWNKSGGVGSASLGLNSSATYRDQMQKISDEAAQASNGTLGNAELASWFGGQPGGSAIDPETLQSLMQMQAQTYALGYNPMYASTWLSRLNKLGDVADLGGNVGGSWIDFLRNLWDNPQIYPGVQPYVPPAG